MYAYFSKTEKKALNNDNLFDDTPVILSCFFHFAQNIERL